jgi:SAM-dependent methyltransferase
MNGTSRVRAHRVHHNRVRFFVQKLADSLANRGLRATLGLVLKNIPYYARQLIDSRFDRKYGVETSGYAFLEKLEITSTNREWGITYQPTSAKHLKIMLSQISADLSEFTFIDFGSGKGRVLLMASEYPFKQIVGVEFAADLHAKAEENIPRYRNARQRCFNIQSLCMDAVDFVIPDGRCVLYFFDPFREDVMRRVLTNIANTYRRTGAKMFLIYYASVHADLVESLGIFKRISVHSLPFDVSLPMQYGFTLFESRDQLV